MISYIIRRLTHGHPINCLGLQLYHLPLFKLPQVDPTTLLIDPSLKPEDKVKLEEKLGLNDPIPVQYGRWLGHMAKGDFGTSFIKTRCTSK